MPSPRWFRRTTIGDRVWYTRLPSPRWFRRKYQAGTSFVFDPMIKPLPTNIVIAAHKTRMGEYIIREYCVNDVLEDGQDVYELKPLNTAFPTLRDNYEVLAVAVAVVDMLI